MHTAVAVVAIEWLCCGGLCVSFGVIIQSIKLLTKVSGFLHVGQLLGSGFSYKPRCFVAHSRVAVVKVSICTTLLFEFSTQPHFYQTPLACFCFVGGVTSEQDPAVLPSNFQP